MYTHLGPKMIYSFVVKLLKECLEVDLYKQPRPVTFYQNILLSLSLYTTPTIGTPHSIGCHSSWCILSYHTHSVATAGLHLVLLGVDNRLI